jgi:acetyl-CoA acetyltransferase
MKCKKSIENNVFQDEIVGVAVKTKQGDKIIEKDEQPKLETTIDGLKRLNPCFKSKSEGGSVTAGNACGVNDGAAMLLLMNVNEAIERNIKPLVKIASWAQGTCSNLLVNTHYFVSSHDNLNMALKFESGLRANTHGRLSNTCHQRMCMSYFF